MDRRDAASILGLGLIGCAAPQSRKPKPTSTGPVRVGAIPARAGGPVGEPSRGHGPGGQQPTRPEQPVSVDDWRRKLEGRRRMQIAELRRYASRQSFPTFIGKDGVRHVRHVEINAREPVFVDHRGVHCAVAHLMNESGWSRAVRSISSTSNNVYIDEVESGPLIRWIETSGLTQQEAALIQPSYSPRPRPVPVKPPPPLPDDHYAEESGRLVQHFHEVGKQLREDSEISIDEALYRLRERIKR